MMVFTMFRVRRKQPKIFNPIVHFISVYMVNYFLRFKKSTQIFFHNKSMLKYSNSTYSSTIRMSWTISKNISTFINNKFYSLSSQLRNNLTFIPSRSTFKNFGKIFASFFSMSKILFTFFRAKFTSIIINPCLKNFEFFFTKLTMSYNLLFSSSYRHNSTPRDRKTFTRTIFSSTVFSSIVRGVKNFIANFAYTFYHSNTLTYNFYFVKQI